MISLGISRCHSKYETDQLIVVGFLGEFLINGSLRPIKCSSNNAPFYDHFSVNRYCCNYVSSFISTYFSCTNYFLFLRPKYNFFIFIIPSFN